MGKLSPLMQQYKKTKAEYDDAILFFRVGDFYETFYEDAETASRVLEITLTSRDKTSDGDAIPMAGVPHHSFDSYLYKMIKGGYKVAICEQVEDPKKAKGLVKREVVRVVTPGTVTDPKALEQKSNNFLAAINIVNKEYGLAYVDLSTGEFSVTQVDSKTKLLGELMRLFPAECLLTEGFSQDDFLELLENKVKPIINRMPDWHFAVESSRRDLCEQFDVFSLEGFGCEDMPAAIGAAGALMRYLNETQKQKAQHILSINTYSVSDYMVLDADTQRNLELTRSMRDHTNSGTLLEILDETLTPMGGRKIRKWLLQPLLDSNQINARLDSVDEFYKNITLQEDLREQLNEMYDMERIISRTNMGSVNARDLLALKDSLQLIPPVKSIIADCESTLIKILNEQLEELNDLTELVEGAIHPEPPTTLTEGGIIRDNFDEELDEFREITSKGKDWITELQQTERERTGISSLKIGHNKVFGYYIEVTNANSDLVPEDYIRKQTLKNSERYIIPELKEKESQIFNAEERINELEYELFCGVREKVSEQTERIQKAASVVAILDVLTSLAYVASKYNYNKPTVEDGDEIIINDGRHPVVERLFTKEGFVPNDVDLNCDDQQMLIITGPNMSGKSTFLRQNALITLMAQMGSFVPASGAKIGVVDRIFTRVGAADYLAMGQSTFLVEMNETANILNNATKKSLLILDEIGRGTSTFDGISIAWAVAEYILDTKRIGAKTLFATHYHELVDLENKYPNVKNYNVAVHKEGKKIVFLRKVVEGGTDQSYGIYVAQLAGLPKMVIERANQILEVLEQHNISIEDDERQKMPKPRQRLPKTTQDENSLQLSLFSVKTHPVVKVLESIDLNNMTPLDALNKLHELKAELEE